MLMAVVLLIPDRGLPDLVGGASSPPHSCCQSSVSSSASGPLAADGWLAAFLPYPPPMRSGSLAQLCDRPRLGTSLRSAGVHHAQALSFKVVAPESSRARA